MTVELFKFRYVSCHRNHFPNKMRFYLVDLIFLCIVLLSVIWKVQCIKCYQCSSIRHRGCFKYNLDTSHLKECGNVSGIPAVCRSLSQINYFTPGQDVVVVRECAYVYNLPLTCFQSKFNNIHYSYVCECTADGCNTTSSVKQNWTLLMFTLLIASI